MEEVSEGKKFAAKYWTDPVGFARDCIKWREGEDLTLYQVEIMGGLPRRKRESVRGPHGLGKSMCAALLIIWFAITRDLAEVDWKIPTTASAWRQLTKFLWPEVAKWIRRLRWEVIPRPPFNPRTEHMKLSLSLRYGEAFAAASDTPEYLEGAHADSMLYVFDESKTIPDKTFDAAEGAFSGAGEDTANEAYAIAISTPGEPSGRFYEIHSRKPGFEDWWVRHVTLKECVRAGRISKQWANQRKKQWGPKSAVYLNRVLGDFASSDEDSVIPLRHVELAIERWREWREKAAPLRNEDFTCVGVDVARGGVDKTVIALRYDEIVTELRDYSRQDTMETTGHVAGVLRGRPNGVAVVDVIGIGSGVVDRLREQNFGVIPFNSSERTDERDRSGEMGFINKRSWAWWNLRELLDPGNGHAVALPDNDLLIGDLTAPHWKPSSNGRIQVESKEDIKDPKRLGRSTDHGDAVVMAFATESGPPLPFSWIQLPEGAVA